MKKCLKIKGEVTDEHISYNLKYSTVDFEADVVYYAKMLWIKSLKHCYE